MREIRFTARFKRDYKRQKTGRYQKTIDAALMEIVNLLAADVPPPPSNVDHPLSGEWADYRDCHIRPDLILIYRKPDDEHLDLVRLGSHSEGKDKGKGKKQGREKIQGEQIEGKGYSDGGRVMAAAHAERGVSGCSPMFRL